MSSCRRWTGSASGTGSAARSRSARADGTSTSPAGSSSPAPIPFPTFRLPRLPPGDRAWVIAGDRASPEQLAVIRQKLGLNEPIAMQFLLWIAQLLRGDLGQSIISSVPVTALIADRLGPSLALGTSTILF